MAIAPSQIVLSLDDISKAISVEISIGGTTHILPLAAFVKAITDISAAVDAILGEALDAGARVDEPAPREEPALATVQPIKRQKQRATPKATGAPNGSFVCSTCSKSHSTARGLGIHQGQMKHGDRATKTAAPHAAPTSPPPADPEPDTGDAERLLRCSSADCDFAVKTTDFGKLRNHVSTEHHRALYAGESTPRTLAELGGGARRVGAAA